MMNDNLLKLQRSPGDIARWQRAQQQVLEGRHAPALATYRDLTVKYPGVTQLWFELGIAASGELDFTFADQAFHKTTEMSAKDAAMLVLVGQQYQRLRRHDRVRECYERALVADPSSPAAGVCLALWNEKERRLQDAWNTIEACLSRNPRDGQALHVRALLLHRQGRGADAEKLLRDMILRGSFEATVQISIRYLLAELLDERGQFLEALQWLHDAKAHARKAANVAALERDYERSAHRRRALLSALTPEVIQRWLEEPPADPCPQGLVLLGGHPRSGTTLLEQILGAHPDVRAFDEPEAFLVEIWNRLDPVNSIQALKVQELDFLSVSRRAEMRRRFLKSLSREGEVESGQQVLLVKDPSSTMALHLWLRVFPDLRVMVAIRDPRDLVISCYFQNLNLTVANVNFLSLERTVEHYCDLMDVWLRMKESGGFDFIEVGYREIVAELDKEGRRATEFMGLSWHPAQAKFQESARQKFLHSPTYDDVTKALHSHAVGRWRNYAEALAPYQKRLAPYCRAFGFEGE